MKIRAVGAELFHADGRTDMKKRDFRLPERSMKTASFCVLTQRIAVISYQHLGITHWSHLSSRYASKKLTLLAA